MLEEMRDLSLTLREPAMEPSEECYLVISDYGPDEGGWGPVAMAMLPFTEPRPLVYTGKDERVIEMFRKLAKQVNEETDQATILAKFTKREDPAVFKKEEK